MYGGTTTITVTIHLAAANKSEYDKAVELIQRRIATTIPRHRISDHQNIKLADVFGKTTITVEPNTSSHG